ncbi:MAG TPA: hypothetical protein EYP18_08400 [Desulfobacterales bacterium]|nr:hypothetical protein [Desulfobacterales bacterium]
MAMRTINVYVIAILTAFTSAHTAFSAEKFMPAIPLLLLGETPAIYKCKATLLADLNGPGNTPYAKRANFTDLGNLTLFFADHSETGSELWVTNGTPGGTHIVKNINPGSEDAIHTSTLSKEIVRVGDKVYFLADDGEEHGEELWITDGTTSGTNMVLDINVGVGDSWINNLTEFNGKLYFLVGNDGQSGSQDRRRGLWVSEGTSATTRVIAANPPTVGTWSGSEPGGTMVVLNHRLIFEGSSHDEGYELWQSDGTTGGTSLLKNINPGNADSKLQQFTVVGSKLYFMADDGTHGMEVWVSDGSSPGTHMVKDINPGPDDGAVMINIDKAFKKNPGFNNKLYFIGSTPAEGAELWITDGTNGGTQLVRDIVPGSGSPFYNGTGSPRLTFPAGEVFNGKFYFTSLRQQFEDGSPYEDEALWRVNEDGSTTIQCFTGGWVNYLTANDNYLFYKTSQGSVQGASRELAIMDKAGRIRVLDILPGGAQSWPKYLHMRNDQSLLFVTNNSRHAPGVGLYQVECPIEGDQ